MSPGGEPSPQFPGQRPPLPPGNAVSLTGGHRSPRVYSRLAKALMAGLLQSRPDLTRYPEAVAAWAENEAQAQLLRRHVAKAGLVDENGEPRNGLLTWLTKLDRAGLKHREVLGLDPGSEARISRDRVDAVTGAVTLEALAEQGRQALASRREIEQDDDLPGRVLAEVQQAAPRPAWSDRA